MATGEWATQVDFIGTSDRPQTNAIVKHFGSHGGAAIGVVASTTQLSVTRLEKRPILTQGRGQTLASAISPLVGGIMDWIEAIGLTGGIEATSA